jgi:hypothetical protein
MITITGIDDHDPPESVITITGIRIALRFGRFGAKRDGDAGGEEGQDDPMPD